MLAKAQAMASKLKTPESTVEAVVSVRSSQDYAIDCDSVVHIVFV
jgi:hypothetical protein